MKKVLLGSLILAVPFVAQAKDYGAAGCGVGSIIFEGQSGLAPHVLAATTNGFYGTQTFAMTSGTLGCDVDGPITSHAALFIDNNMDNIARDMAKGKGEAILALSYLMNIEEEDRVRFTSVLKENFEQVYPNESVTSTDVMASLVDIMSSDEVLVKYVG